MSCPSLNIGLIAYGVTGDHVMVKVPNERGRWMLVARCVIEVGCRTCLAIAGEPCRNGKRGAMMRYHVQTHVMRRADAAEKFGRGSHRHAPPHKLRITPDDLADADGVP